MIMDHIFYQAIKEHVESREELEGLKIFRVLNSQFTTNVKCSFGDDSSLVRFRVVTSVARKHEYEPNRVVWCVCVYDNPTGDRENTIHVFFEDSYIHHDPIE